MAHLTIIILALVLLVVPPAYAGVIAPELAARISAAPASSPIPVIINLSEKADLSRIKDLDKKERRRRVVHELRAKAETSQLPLLAFLGRLNAAGVKPLWIKNAVAATLPVELLGAIAALPGVESIVSDAVIHAPVVQAATAAEPEWNISRINAPALWAAGITGSAVVVANMDTGVYKDHQDLAGSFRGGTNSWYDPYTASTSPYDSDATSHGTGTMGVMVGGSAGGKAIGVAPGALWIAAKIFNDAGTAIESDITGAFQWLLDPDSNSATDDAPDVVNASWGYKDNPNECIDIFRQAIDNLKVAGIAVVFSAGNNGSSATPSSVSPANNVGSFAVGATRINDNIASFSSRGPSVCDGSVFPHLVAPGENISLASKTGSYVLGNGTSFAAPHVSGAMALLLSAFPSLTPAELETALIQTAVPFGSPVPNNDYGYGLLDVSAAYIYIFDSLRSNDPVERVIGLIPVATYADIQSAYDSSSDNDIIRAEDTLFPEYIDFASMADIMVSLSGGYNTAFSGVTGYSTIQGSLTISRGTAVISNIILQ